MSSKSKGASKENLCKKELESEGYMVIFKSCTVKRGPFFVGLDVADLFDIICVRRAPFQGTLTGLPEWKFISVKNWADGRKHPQHQADIAEFKEYYELKGISFELWLWQKARWRGRGTARHFEQAKWEKVSV